MLRNKHENTFKEYLTGRMRKRWDMQSVEDRYSTGIPDTNYCCERCEGWMELKVIKHWPKRAATTLHTQLLHLTFEQCNWLRYRNVRHGGTTWLFIKVMATKEYVLLHGRDARAVKDSTEAKVRELAVAVWPDSIPVVELIGHLTRYKKKGG